MRNNCHEIYCEKCLVGNITLVSTMSFPTGLAQQNLGLKAKILYGVFLYVNIN